MADSSARPGSLAPGNARPGSHSCFNSISTAAIACFALFSVAILLATHSPYLAASTSQMLPKLSSAVDNRVLSGDEREGTVTLTAAQPELAGDGSAQANAAAALAEDAFEEEEVVNPANDAHLSSLPAFEYTDTDAEDLALSQTSADDHTSDDGTSTDTDAQPAPQSSANPSQPPEAELQHSSEPGCDVGVSQPEETVQEPQPPQAAALLSPPTDAGLWLSLPSTFGAETVDDFDWCPGSLEKESAAKTPVTYRNAAGQDIEPQTLFVIGAQKAGTTWLFNVLEQHSAFNGALHAFKQGPGPWRKELHYFNRWPPPSVDEFLPCFSTASLEAAVLVGASDSRAFSPLAAGDDAGERGASGQEEWPIATARKFAPGSRRLRVLQNNKAVTLVDGTPEYLFDPHAPARIKRAFPNARFVVVLRDPVARVYSAWRMTRRVRCPDVEGLSSGAPPEPCPVKPFYDFVKNEHKALKRPPGCLFDKPTDMSWGSCFRCFYSHVNDTACDEMEPAIRQAASSCGHPQTFTSLDVSNYAPQLAWWLRFFPPEQILVLTSQELRSYDTQVQALNRVRLHAGLPATPPFTQDMLDEASGYDGHYTTDALSRSEKQAIELLRHLYREPMQQLKWLLRTAFNMTQFEGLQDEI